MDYNLLHNLVVMAKSSTLKQAAAKLMRSEGAVSKDLAKLREQLQDPLISRIEGKNQLSPFMRELLPKLEQGFSQLDNTLLPSEFVASEFTGRITLALNSHLFEIYGKKIYQQLKLEFPQALFTIRNWGADTEKGLLNEEVDIGFHLFNQERSQSIRQLSIKNIHLAIVSSAKHPVSSLDDLKQRTMVISNIPGWNENRRVFLEALQSNGYSIKNKLVVDKFAIAKELIFESDLVMIAPVELFDLSGGFATLAIPESVINHSLKLCINIKANFMNSTRHKTIISAIQKSVADS
ncbi:LysR family transcriptional regulator [Shewanella sp. Isolate11]|uniref:LysR family transcriptional regulator n=1 Tax=Shewanella sp. Isolate11 TaxID=2908530 RepID=UPI001EFD82D7|nr:LysR family transcriptional regulator [Shewanella sp. Isolate11]MCG9696092.1 LysR family transcriptional regulator [Shewanella sp. Isolate11]